MSLIAKITKITPVGIALGGGGARGAAHIGVLRHFEKINLNLKAISGTSAGAIIATLYAFGIPLEVIDNEIEKLRPADMKSFRLGQLGLFESSHIEIMLKKLLPENALIENAKIALGINTTDLVSGKSVILTKGPVIQAVQASTCVPGFYIPIEYEQQLLVDGGITENVPIKALRLLGAKVKIAVNLNGQLHYNKPEGLLEVVSNAMDIAIDSRTKDQLDEAEIIISMDLSQFPRISPSAHKSLVEIGETIAKEQVANLWLFQWWLIFKKSLRWVKKWSFIKIPEKIRSLF